MFERIAAEPTLSQGTRIDELRDAIKANRLSFPVPVPIFPSQFRPDIQWRLVELYFVRGWSSRQLAERYGVTARRIQQSLQHWVGRAMERGYLQEIPPETVFALPPVFARTAVDIRVAEVPRYVPIPAAATPGYAASPPA